MCVCVYSLWLVRWVLCEFGVGADAAAAATASLRKTVRNCFTCVSMVFVRARALLEDLNAVGSMLLPGMGLVCRWVLGF